jgi:hypothetical protein
MRDEAERRGMQKNEGKLLKSRQCVFVVNVILNSLLFAQYSTYILACFTALYARHIFVHGEVPECDIISIKHKSIHLPLSVSTAKHLLLILYSSIPMPIAILSRFPINTTPQRVRT